MRVPNHAASGMSGHRTVGRFTAIAAPLSNTSMVVSQTVAQCLPLSG